jgi:hypothetical protein
LDITLEAQKCRVRNPLKRELRFCIENTLKLTHNHLEVRKVFRGRSPLDPQEGEGKGRVGRGGEIGEGRGRRGKRGGDRRGGKERGRNVAPVKIPQKRLCFPRMF